MSEWDSYAADWDDDPAALAYAVAAFESLETALDPLDMTLDGANVLDFGCGTGLLTERLVDMAATITAVDTSTAMLDVLRAKIAARGWSNVTTATELPTEPGSHQLIVCSSVCSFLDDYPGMVRTLAELMAQGALFVQWDWERDETDDDEHGLSRRQIADALHAAGLEQVSVDVAFEIPFEAQLMRPLIGYGVRPAKHSKM